MVAHARSRGMCSNCSSIRIVDISPRRFRNTSLEECPLALLRVSAWIVLLLSLLDISRTAEHEITFPSRVALLVDGSASMTLAAHAEPVDVASNQTEREISRARVAKNILFDSPLVTALRNTHEVSVWSFSTDSEKVVLLPQEKQPNENSVKPDDPPEWNEKLLSQGTETRLGDALPECHAREPDESLAGMILRQMVGIMQEWTQYRRQLRLLIHRRLYVIGLGSDRLPANVRVADLLAPPRIFPGDSFSITGYLQSQDWKARSLKLNSSKLRWELRSMRLLRNRLVVL